MKNYFSPIQTSFAVFLMSVFFLSLVLAAGYSFAEPTDSEQPRQCHKKGKHRGHEKGLSHMLSKLERKLDLTDAQKQSMQNVVSEYEPQLKSVHEQMHEGKMAGKAIIDQDVLDEASLQNHVNQQAELFKEMISLKSKAMHAIHVQLTPQQKAKMQEMFEQRHQRHVSKVAM